MISWQPSAKPAATKSRHRTTSTRACTHINRDWIVAARRGMVLTLDTRRPSFGLSLGGGGAFTPRYVPPCLPSAHAPDCRLVTPKRSASSGTGKLYLEDVSTWLVGPSSVFVLPTPMRHDLENTCKETLRAVAFLAPRCLPRISTRSCYRRRGISSAREPQRLLIATACIGRACAARPWHSRDGRARQPTKSCRRD